MHPERDKRAKGLYHTDERIQIKYSGKNPTVKLIYDEIIKGRNHELLHIKYLK
jgi:NADH-quinone oxidoreductase subunit G